MSEFDKNFKKLHELELDNTDIQIYVVKRVGHIHKLKFTNRTEKDYTYDIKILHTDDKIMKTLYGVVNKQIQKWNMIIPYKSGKQDTAPETALCVDCSSTDLIKIIAQIERINSEQKEESIITNPDDLVDMWMYIVRIQSNDDSDKPVYAVRRVSNSWALKKIKKNALNASMKNGNLTDIGDSPIFTVDKVIDFLSYNGTIFVHIKPNFEMLLNLRISMLIKKEAVIGDFKKLGFIDDEELFSTIIGNKLLSLQKIASICEGELYKDKDRMNRLIKKTKEEHWILEFTDDGKINLNKYQNNPELTIYMLRELNSEKKQDLIDGSICYAGSTSEVPKIE